MIDQLEADRPGTKAVMLAALQNVRPSHLLDRRLWNALGVQAARDDEDAAGGEGAIIAEQRLVRGSAG
jgi:tRNA 2-thiocytidine biosynthesis protein TtcA